MGIDENNSKSQDHINILEDRLVHMHLHDNYKDGDYHNIPGEGDIEWDQVFKALGSLSKPPRLILELRDRRELLKAANYLIGNGYCV